MNTSLTDTYPLTPEHWLAWIDRWVKSENTRPPALENRWPILYDEKGHEWFLKWAGHPHIADAEGTGLCDDCGRRSFVWAANFFLGRKCLLCFKRHDP